MYDIGDKKRIEVCFSPNLFPLHSQDHEIVVVIDVLRATSAICTAFHYGVEGIIPVATIEEALEYKNKGYIVAAERDGKVVEGFQFGNSPYSYQDEQLKGQTVVLSTTNGTRAIDIAKQHGLVVIGSLLNLDAIIKWLNDQKKNTLLLCSGWHNKFNLEDTICAGAIANGLLDLGGFASIEDSSIAAKYLFLSAKDNYFGYLKSSSHRRRLKKLKLNEDIKFCLTPNLTTEIPVLKDGRLVKMPSDIFV